MMFKAFSFDNFGKSKEKINEELAEYEKAIFPLGDQHKQKIKDLLFQIDSKKLHQIDIMISYVEGKQIYQKNQNITAVYKLIRNKRTILSNEKIKDVIALIILDMQCDSIDELPQLEQVQDFAKSLELPK
jgi:hypothetical protein